MADGCFPWLYLRDDNRNSDKKKKKKKKKEEDEDEKNKLPPVPASEMVR